MSLYKTEFPEYDGELPTLPGFVDTSSRNDAMPSIEKDYGQGVTIRITCDYVDPALREWKCATKRFCLIGYCPNDDQGSVLGEWDEFANVAKRVQMYEVAMSLNPLTLANEFCVQLRKELFPDATKIIPEINARNDHEEAIGDTATCATHDFCDANQVMLNAIEFCGGDSDFHFLSLVPTDAAWTIARKARFDQDLCVDPKDTLKLRLIFNVEYEPNGVPHEMLVNMLSGMCDEAMGLGWMTGYTAAEVVHTSCKVERV